MSNEQYDPQLVEVEIAAAGISIAECETEKEARFLSFVLNNAGIQSGVLVPHGRFDLRYPQVRVAPDDVDRAKAVLTQPITAKLREEFDELIEDFEVPGCPGCGSREILLESVELGNKWKCDECGHSWTS